MEATHSSDVHGLPVCDQRYQLTRSKCTTYADTVSSEGWTPPANYDKTAPSNNFQYQLHDTSASLQEGGADYVQEGPSPAEKDQASNQAVGEGVVQQPDGPRGTQGSSSRPKARPKLSIPEQAGAELRELIEMMTAADKKKEIERLRLVGDNDFEWYRENTTAQRRLLEVKLLGLPARPYELPHARAPAPLPGAVPDVDAQDYQPSDGEDEPPASVPRATRARVAAAASAATAAASAPTAAASAATAATIAAPTSSATVSTSVVPAVVASANVDFASTDRAQDGRHVPAPPTSPQQPTMSNSNRDATQPLGSPPAADNGDVSNEGSEDGLRQMISGTQTRSSHVLHTSDHLLADSRSATPEADGEHDKVHRTNSPAALSPPGTPASTRTSEHAALTLQAGPAPSIMVQAGSGPSFVVQAGSTPSFVVQTTVSTAPSATDERDELTPEPCFEDLPPDAKWIEEMYKTLANATVIPAYRLVWLLLLADWIELERVMGFTYVVRRAQYRLSTHADVPRRGLVSRRSTGQRKSRSGFRTLAKDSSLSRQRIHTRSAGSSGGVTATLSGANAQPTSILSLAARGTGPACWFRVRTGSF